MKTDLTNPIYNDEDAARAHFEAIRWPNGPVCPHCGVVDQATELKGKSTRKGVYKCKACRKPFSATIGTLYERSHIPLHKWMLATHLITSSKKGISAHQLFRMLGFGSYRTAWFMAMRIRESMDESNSGPLGGGGKTIEADEVYVGPGKHIFVNGVGWVRQRGPGGMTRVLTLVERGGRARSVKMNDLRAATVRKAIMENASTDSVLNTDEARFYKRIGKEFAGHGSVNHTIEEYVRDGITTNTVEGFFAIFRRGMKGIYQHCSEKHLQRYFHEFDFRYSNRIALGCDDDERALRALKGVAGKRLTYRQPHQGAQAKA